MASPKEHLMSWLRDAHAMEKQAIASTENQLKRLENYPELRAWVQDHVDSAHRQRDTIRRCIERNGGDVSTIKDAVMSVTGKFQEMTGMVMADEVLKNAIGDYAFKYYEIASYTSLGSAADAAGDAETRRVADDNRAEEEALAERLAQLIPELTREYLSRDAASEPAKR